MKKWAKQLEIFVDRIIPPVLIVLLAVIVIELFFDDIAHQFHLTIQLLDYFIILVFIIDLIFKYRRIKPFRKFLIHSWLDIIAIFPFVLVFRIFEGIVGTLTFSGVLRQGQTILHETVELEKEVVKTIQTVEKSGKVSRSSKLIRLIRPVARMPRLLKAFAFFDIPFMHKHEHSRPKSHKK